VSTGHSSSLLGVCLGIMMSEASPTVSLAEKGQVTQPCSGTYASALRSRDPTLQIIAYISNISWTPSLSSPNQYGISGKQRHRKTCPRSCTNTLVLP
jgi:hypothetical protein